MTETASPENEKDRIVSLLRDEWDELSQLLATLTADEWSAAALPGWDVHDTVAHIVGTERSLAGHERPDIPVDADQRAHIRNDMGKNNEAWIEHYRSRTDAELLADFRDITAKRLATLDAMTGEQFNAPSWTPAGQATHARFMRIRAFDSWMHEQDIRSAVGKPGHDGGPVAAESLDEVVVALGYIVGKRGGAADGSSVSFHLTGPLARELHVLVDGRAQVVDSLTSPATVTITMPGTLFMRLAGGRVDPLAMIGQITFAGDVEFGHRVATNLAYTI